MALRLQIISRHRQGLGERGSKEFGHSGGTIGRSLESDWVLPDGQRYLSSRHASIDYRSGSYYIVDTSTNGVYVNDAEQPVGRGNPQRLFNGDRLRIGEYEMSVEIEEESDTNAHLTDSGHVDPVTKAQRVPPPDPTRADLVPAHEITAVGIEMLLDDEAEESLRLMTKPKRAADLRLEEDPPSKPARAPEPAPAPAHATTSAPAAKRVEPPPVSAAARVATAPAKAPAKAAPAGAAAATPAAKPTAVAPQAAIAPKPAPAPLKAAQPLAPKSPPAPTAKSGSAGAATSTGALEAFFRGAGLPAPKLDDKQIADTMHRLGQVMRELVLGISDNLHVRGEHKNVLRVPTTAIQPQSNNPLKFSASVEEALHNLLFRESGEYLTAVEAVREAFVDIKQHQQHLLAALRAAVVGYVSKLDPEELESKFTRRNGLINAANKLKYWDLYRDLYQVVTQAQPGQLPPQFLEELARAYEAETARAAPASSVASRNPGAKIG
jgi:type VI secretion system protein